MTRFLATPAAFATLAVALAGWLLAWSIPPISPFGDLNTVNHVAHRPALATIRGQPGLSIHSNVRMAVCYASPVKYNVVYEQAGTLHADYILASDLDATLKDATAAAVFYPLVHTDDFGLLAPVVFRRVFSIKLINTNTGLPLPETTAAYEAISSAGLATRPHAVPEFNAKAAAHDLLFLLTLSAFARSALAVPAWPIWRRITPAQRRRMRNACSRCAYDRTGIASDAPCPECGTN